MSEIKKRKDDHLRINLEQAVGSSITTGFEHYYYVHECLPELDLAKVNTECRFLSHDLKIPLLISSMTGGTPAGDRINIHLAQAAQTAGIAMGIGSQRSSIENKEFEQSKKLRREAPEILMFANIGAIQLNYGFGIEECKKAVDLIDANGLILHLNPLQEALQTGGQTNFSGLLEKIEVVCRNIDIPVIVKEVGWGISAATAKKLVEVGVSGIDIAGAGGTSWSEVEKYRSEDEMMYRISSQFHDWGIPTAEALKNIHEALPGTLLVASGGLRRGLDLAKSISLGAAIGGFGGVLLKAATESSESVLELIGEIAKELKIAMFAAGAGDIEKLAQTKLVERKNE